MSDSFTCLIYVLDATGTSIERYTIRANPKMYGDEPTNLVIDGRLFKMFCFSGELFLDVRYTGRVYDSYPFCYRVALCGVVSGNQYHQLRDLTEFEIRWIESHINVEPNKRFPRIGPVAGTLRAFYDNGEFS